ncbi:MAG: maleylpyruvate isomerase family mycothiol-dependent enzyme [Thermomicrobiales bacterium]
MDATRFTLLPPLDLRDRFPGLRAELTALLRGLSPEEWNRETVCPGWSVQDIAAHLLADDLGRLSWGRDRFVSPTFAAGLDIDTLPGFIQAIDRQNGVWVAAARRFSPALLLDLLTVSGEWTEAYFASLDLNAIGMPVDWAGPDPAPVWLDVAREYTERWVHQQQIRDAVGQPGLKERQWLHPVLATFVRALPLALTPVNAPDGTAVRLTITGDAGGAWVARRDVGKWLLGAAPDLAVDATVTLDQETAWRLFTKGIAKNEARQRATIAGDRALAEHILSTVSILA